MSDGNKVRKYKPKAKKLKITGWSSNMWTSMMLILADFISMHVKHYEVVDSPLQKICT